MFVLLYLYDYCCIVITSYLLADSLVLFRHLLHILGTLQGVEQGSIIHGVILSVCAEKDAVKCLKFHGLDIRHSTSHTAWLATSRRSAPPMPSQTTNKVR